MNGDVRRDEVTSFSGLVHSSALPVATGAPAERLIPPSCPNAHQRQTLRSLHNHHVVVGG